jgi:hypothetical protein
MGATGTSLIDGSLVTGFFAVGNTVFSVAWRFVVLAGASFSDFFNVLERFAGGVTRSGDAARFRAGMLRARGLGLSAGLTRG